MTVRTASMTPQPQPSRVIAEALLQRHGPCRIVSRAASLGLSRQLTRVILVACGATAVDATRTIQRQSATVS